MVGKLTIDTLYHGYFWICWTFFYEFFNKYNFKEFTPIILGSCLIQATWNVSRGSGDDILLFNAYFSSPPPHGVTAPSGPGPPHYRGLTITLRHTTLGRAPLDEWSARRRDLYLTTHNTHKRQTSVPPAVFEPTVPASERPQTHVLERTATRIGKQYIYLIILR
jgi:hypothetical protein